MDYGVFWKLGSCGFGRQLDRDSSAQKSLGKKARSKGSSCHWSFEREQLSALKRSLVVYRMVFGQNRQEDLTNYLLDNVPASEIKRVSEELRITLEPPSIEN
jgi:hypothetical protein